MAIATSRRGSNSEVACQTESELTHDETIDHHYYAEGLEGSSRRNGEKIPKVLPCSRKNDRVTFCAALTICTRRYTDKSGHLKIGGMPNSAEIHCLTVAPGSHNAEVEGSSPSLATSKINDLRVNFVA
jgi:hypothetical protein